MLQLCFNELVSDYSSVRDPGLRELRVIVRYFSDIEQHLITRYLCLIGKHAFG